MSAPADTWEEQHDQAVVRWMLETYRSCRTSLYRVPELAAFADHGGRKINNKALWMLRKWAKEYGVFEKPQSEAKSSGEDLDNGAAAEASTSEQRGDRTPKPARTSSTLPSRKRLQEADDSDDQLDSDGRLAGATTPRNPLTPSPRKRGRALAAIASPKTPPSSLGLSQLNLASPTATSKSKAKGKQRAVSPRLLPNPGSDEEEPVDEGRAASSGISETSSDAERLSRTPNSGKIYLPPKARLPVWSSDEEEQVHRTRRAVKAKMPREDSDVDDDDDSIVFAGSKAASPRPTLGSPLSKAASPTQSQSPSRLATPDEGGPGARLAERHSQHGERARSIHSGVDEEQHHGGASLAASSASAAKPALTDAVERPSTPSKLPPPNAWDFTSDDWRPEDPVFLATPPRHIGPGDSDGEEQEEPLFRRSPPSRPASSVGQREQEKAGGGEGEEGRQVHVCIIEDVFDEQQDAEDDEKGEASSQEDDGPRDAGEAHSSKHCSAPSAQTGAVSSGESSLKASTERQLEREARSPSNSGCTSTKKTTPHSHAKKAESERTRSSASASASPIKSGRLAKSKRASASPHASTEGSKVGTKSKAGASSATASTSNGPRGERERIEISLCSSASEGEGEGEGGDESGGERGAGADSDSEVLS